LSEPASVMNWNVTHCRQLAMEFMMVTSSRLRFQLKEGDSCGERLSVDLAHALGEFPGELEVARLAPHHVGVLGVGVPRTACASPFFTR
jgi:hypothetical protein